MRAFERELRSAASTARQHAAGYTESTSSLQVPQPARLAHDQRSDTAMGQSDTTARVPRQSVAGSSSESIQRRERPTRYLLLCVNVKSLTELVHIDVASYQNDQYLFDAIRKEYERIRERTTWNPFMLVSTYVPTPVWMRLPTWAVWLGRAHVEAPRSAVFVRVRFNISTAPSEIIVFRANRCSSVLPQKERRSVLQSLMPLIFLRQKRSKS